MRKIFAAAAVVALAVIGSMTTAHASTSPRSGAENAPAVTRPADGVAPMAGPYRMKNRGTGLCLGTTHGIAGMGTCTSANHLWWYWNQHADGWWEIKSLSSGLCLTGFSGNQVAVNPCGQAGQKWQRVADGHINLSGAFNVLDANQVDVYLHPWNDGPYQKWDLLIV